jgi:predicted nucleic acid-binding protein
VTAVIDASVIVKWLLQDPEREPDTDKATALLESVAGGETAILQPVHWLVEVAAVLARVTPQTAVDDIDKLAAMEFPTTNEPDVLRRAAQLAIDTGQHLFDTLYHAVALENPDTVLVTADDRYREKVAQKHHQIVALRDWVPLAPQT